MGRNTSDLRVLGQQALQAFGVRLALLFLATAAAGIPLMAQTVGVGWSLALVPAIAVCGQAVRSSLAWGAPPDRMIWALVCTLGVTAAVLALTTTYGDVRGYEVSAWIVAGFAAGVAVARGPGSGFGTFTALLAITITIGAVAHRPAPLITLAGPLTFVVGGAVINVATRRGFAITQEAMAGAESAEAAHRVAIERWRARRETDRALHDTVLATLTLLSQGGVGVAEESLRKRCARDVAELNVGPAATPGSQAAGSGARTSWLAEVAAQAEAEGLSLVLHQGAGDIGTEMSGDRRAAVEAAVRQCLANVARHAGTSEAEISSVRSGRELMVMVVDRGLGFRPEAVPSDRLGLRAGVRDRIEDAGGRVNIWSGHGQGTSVVIWMPLDEMTR